MSATKGRNIGIAGFLPPRSSLCGQFATVVTAYFEYVCGFLVNSADAAHFVMVIKASSIFHWMQNEAGYRSRKLDGTI